MQIRLDTKAIAAVTVKAKVAGVGTLAREALHPRILRPSSCTIAARLAQRFFDDTFTVVVSAANAPLVLAPVVTYLVVVAEVVVVPGLCMMTVFAAVSARLVLAVVLAVKVLGWHLLFDGCWLGIAMVPPLPSAFLQQSTLAVLHIAPKPRVVQQSTIVVRNAAIFKRNVAAAPKLRVDLTRTLSIACLFFALDTTLLTPFFSLVTISYLSRHLLVSVCGRRGQH